MPPFGIAWLFGCLYAVYCFRWVGCKGPEGSDDAMHMLKLWVAASNMRQGKMVLWTGSMVALQSDCSGWMAYLAGAVLLGAEEAWPRSTQTRSLLLTKLRGKSSCPWAESATGRPAGLGSGAYSEAFCRGVVPEHWPLAAAKLCHERVCNVN